jgi:hypothetical protein
MSSVCGLPRLPRTDMRWTARRSVGVEVDDALAVAEQVDI